MQKVNVFLKPRDLNQAIDYMTEINGIYQHNFYESKHSNPDKCFICGKTITFHMDFNSRVEKMKGAIRNVVDIITEGIKTYFKDDIENNDNKDNDIQIKVDDEYNRNSIDIMNECLICYKNITYREKEENKLPCGHKICDICLFEYIKNQIETAQIENIHCFAYKCQQILLEDYILKVIKNNKILIDKYNIFKKKAEILSCPTKKFCPEKDCNSFLERKEGQDKYVSCEKGHKYCFVCLKPWHNKSKCNEELDKDFQLWKQNKIIKRCPKCRFYTEKNEGCNHMTCAECKYQWCWLCEKKYEYNHYSNGACAGQQFYKGDKPNEKEKERYLQQRQRNRDRIRNRNHEIEETSILQNYYIKISTRSHNICMKIAIFFFVVFFIAGLGTSLIYYEFIVFPERHHPRKFTRKMLSFLNILALLFTIVNIIIYQIFFFPLTLVYLLLTSPFRGVNLIRLLFEC